jgi:hypothetical protein
MFGCFQSSNLTPGKVIQCFCKAIILMTCTVNIFLLFSDLSNSSQHEFFASVLPYEALIVLNTIVVPGIFCDLPDLVSVWIVVYAILLLVGAILIAYNQQIPALIPIASNTAAYMVCYLFNITDLDEMQMEKLGFVITLGLYLMVFISDVILTGTKQEAPTLPFFLPSRTINYPPTEPTPNRVPSSTSIQSLPTYSEAEMLPSYDQAAKQEVQQK